MPDFHRHTRLKAVLLSSAAVLATPLAQAQLNSTSATVTLSATLAETLSITTNISSVNFTLASGGAATGSAPVSITTNWTLNPSRSSVHLYAWFTTPAGALTDGGTPANNIPSSAVFGQVTSGLPTTFAAFTQTNGLGTAGGGLHLFNQAITSANRSANRSDNLNLKIDLTTLPQLPAGTYNGTLTIQAQSL